MTMADIAILLRTRKLEPRHTFIDCTAGSRTPEELASLPWHASVARNRRTGTEHVAVRRLWKENGKWKSEYLHRAVLGMEPGDRRCVDHKDGNPLNNRLGNLRVCSPAQNTRNRVKPVLSCNGLPTSRFKGVHLRKDRATCPKRWIAGIGMNGKWKTIGHFRDEMDAAVAYDCAALEAYGEYAKTNKSLGLLP